MQRRIRTRIAQVVLLLACAGMVACSSAVRFESDPPGIYTVRRGDTLFSIALRNDLDWRELASWNGIGAPYALEVGRPLKLAPTAKGGHATARPPRPAPRPLPPPGNPLGWSWPATGKVVMQFRPGLASAKGIDIAGTRGDEVRAAFDGKVVYVGSGLVGYGKVIIIKHDDRYLSAYAHNDRFLVEEGATVKRGQPIAAMGLGPGQRALLHFEIRLDGRAVDPLPLLPKR